MKNGVTMFELPADDIDRVRKFYSEVFGWKMVAMAEHETVPYRVGQARSERRTVQAIPTEVGENGFPTEVGIITGVSAERTSELKGTVIFLEVDDVEAALSRVEAHGGRTIVPCTPVAEVGSFAYFEDSEGNPIGLWRDVTPGIRVGVVATMYAS